MSNEEIVHGTRSHTDRARERAKEDKRERIMAAARELFAEHGVSGVTTQQVADRADVAIVWGSGIRMCL